MRERSLASEPALRRALACALLAGWALWLALMVTDEIVIAFEPEATHIGILIAQLATPLLLLQLRRQSAGDEPSGRT